VFTISRPVHGLSFLADHVQQSSCFSEDKLAHNPRENNLQVNRDKSRNIVFTSLSARLSFLFARSLPFKHVKQLFHLLVHARRRRFIGR